MSDLSRRDLMRLLGAGCLGAVLPALPWQPFQPPLAPSVARAQGPAMTLDTLLAAFAGMPGLSARFSEEKRMAMLAVPLRSEGEIFFAPPDRLVRRVTSPRPSTALLVGGRLTLDSGGRRQEIDLGQSEIVEGFVDTFRQVLAGDRAALEGTYRISFATESETWRITLRPKTDALQRFLRDMVLEGDGQTLKTMTMNEANGDTSVTTFREVNARRRFSPEETARIFRL